VYTSSISSYSRSTSAELVVTCSLRRDVPSVEEVKTPTFNRTHTSVACQ